MSHRRVIALATTIASITLLAACSSGGGASSSGSNSTPYKVAGVFALTGADAGTDTSAAASLKATVAYLNANGGVNGHKLEYQILDSQSNPSNVQLAVRSLADNYHPDVIIPDIICQLSLAGAPVANQAKIVSFTGCDTSSSLNVPGPPADGKKYPYTFTTFPAGFTAAAGMVAGAKTLEGTSSIKVGELNSNDASGTASVAPIKAAAIAAGMTWVGNQTFTVGAPDVSVQLSQLKQAGAQVVFGWGQTGDGLTMMKGVSSLNWHDVQIIGDTGVASASLVQQMPAAYQKQFHAVVPANAIRPAGSTTLTPFLQSYLMKQSSVVQNMPVVDAVHDGLTLWAWAVNQIHTTDTNKVVAELQKLSTITDPSQRPQGLMLGVQPQYTSTQHGLGSSDLASVWGLMQPSTCIEGTYEGLKINI